MPVHTPLYLKLHLVQALTRQVEGIVRGAWGCMSACGVHTDREQRAPLCVAGRERLLWIPLQPHARSAEPVRSCGEGSGEMVALQRLARG